MNYKNKVEIVNNDTDEKITTVFNDYEEIDDYIIIDKYLLGESIGRQLCDYYENSTCNWENVRTEVELLTDEIANTIYYIAEEFVINNLNGKYED